MLEEHTTSLTFVECLAEPNSLAYEANRLANPRRTSTGGIDNLPVYSLAIANMMTISVEENEELASTRGVTNVVTQPIWKSEPAKIYRQSLEGLDAYKKIHRF